MVNKYVDFVSDEDFMESIKWICNSYPQNNGIEVDMEKLQKNTVDPFKMLFDICNTDVDIKTWVKNEEIRQSDKTVNNKVGEFHQKLLGCVDGWEDLETGHESQIDLKNTNNTIFIELKNKHNTMNSSSTDSCRNKLEKVIKKYPNAKAYWGFIITKDGSSGENNWEYQNKNDAKIRKIWGKKVYELITGDPEALDKLWIAIPIAIKDLLKKKKSLPKDVEQNLLEFFQVAFQQ